MMAAIQGAETVEAHGIVKPPTEPHTVDGVTRCHCGKVHIDTTTESEK